MKTNSDDNDKAIDDNSISNIEIIKSLAPFLWPHNNFWYRIRVIFSFLCLILAKVFTVLIPLSLIWLVDSFSLGDDKSGEKFLLAFGTLSLVIIYNIVRLLSIGFTQLRDGVFAVVGQNAIRLIALQTFDHIHSLSLRFHLTRKTGAISRIVERGVIATEFLLRFLFFNVIPLVFEFVQPLFVTKSS